MIEHFDEPDALPHHVEDNHAALRTQNHVAMAGAIRAVGARRGVKALAEVIAASALGDDAQIAHADAEVELAFDVEQSDEFCAEGWIHLAQEWWLGRRLRIAHRSMLVVTRGPGKCAAAAQ